MTAKATQQSVKSIIRRATRQPDQKLNILTFCAHERYEQNLCRTGHNFYSLNHGKRWNKDYGAIPENYTEIEAVPLHIGFDLILSHTSCERLGIAKEIQSIFNIPILRHTHVLPDIRFEVPPQVEAFGGIDVEKNTFISEYNMKAWGFDSTTASFIEHGIDYGFWSNKGASSRQPVCLSVVNEWPDRDWCCGWELWKYIVGLDKNMSLTSTKLPIRVLGNSPGLSKAADTIEELRDAYQSSLIFLNTSIHSPVPTVLMEAMACGCAIVSTDNCMIPDIIEHGYNGLLSNDPHQLREFCRDLIRNPEKAEELGKNAQETIREKYNLNNFVSSWNKTLLDTVKNYRK